MTRQGKARQDSPPPPPPSIFLFFSGIMNWSWGIPIFVSSDPTVSSPSLSISQTKFHKLSTLPSHTQKRCKTKQFDSGTKTHTPTLALHQNSKAKYQCNHTHSGIPSILFFPLTLSDMPRYSTPKLSHTCKAVNQLRVHTNDIPHRG